MFSTYSFCCALSFTSEVLYHQNQYNGDDGACHDASNPLSPVVQIEGFEREECEAIDKYEDDGVIGVFA